MMNVRAIMTTTPVTVQPDTPLEKAWDLMTEHCLRHLPVVLADGRFVGLVSDHDVRAKVADGGPVALAQEVLGITNLGTFTLGGEEPLDQVWTMMGRWPGLNTLPVVRFGKLIGTVSRRELLRAMAGLSPRDGVPARQDASILRQWAAKCLPAIARGRPMVDRTRLDPESRPADSNVGWRRAPTG